MDLAKDSLTDWMHLAFTVLGGFYALYLLWKSNKEKKNRYILDILDRLYNDIEIRTIIYAVDSGKDVEEIKFGGKLEKEADKTIRYFDYLGYLQKKGSLHINDIKPFNYEINRILDNESVRVYVKWLILNKVNLEYLDHLKSSLKKSIK